MAEHQGYIFSQILEKKGITQTEVAEKLGVTRQAVMQYFKAKKLRNDTFEKMLDALNVSEHEFEEMSSNVEEPPMIYGNGTDRYKRPYYEIDIFATPNIEVLSDLNNSPPTAFISIPHFTDAEMYVRVRGDSMYPKYRHGDIIPVKRVQHTAFFVFYEPYVIFTQTNRMRMIKYIHPHETDKDKLLLVSYDSAKFKSQEIDKEEIFALYYVLGKIEI